MTIKPKGAVAAAAETSAAVSRTFEKAVESIKRGASQAMHSDAASPHQDQAQPKPTQGAHPLMKTAEQLAQFHQSNVEAFMKSGQIWATGLQDLSKTMATTAQAAFEESMSTFRALSGVKSLKEAFDLQTSYARTSMEKAMTESSKLTESSLRLAEQAAAPLSARVTAAVEVFRA